MRALPDIGLDFRSWYGGRELWGLVIGLTLYNMVVFGEIVRAGVASLPRGQQEAALATGLTRWQSMRLVLLPQAFRVMLPAIISQLVVVLKDTSLVAFVGSYPELLGRGRDIQRNLDNPIQTFIVVAVLFIVLNYALSRLAQAVQRRQSRRGRSAAAKAQQQTTTAAPEPSSTEGLGSAQRLPAAVVGLLALGGQRVLDHRQRHARRVALAGQHAGEPADPDLVVEAPGRPDPLGHQRLCGGPLGRRRRPPRARCARPRRRRP